MPEEQPPVPMPHAPDLPSAGDDTRFCRRTLFGTLAVWGVFWTLIPLILLEGIYFDVLENLEWGRYWQFGYDKHPFISMWISRAVFELTGSPAWLYLLNQISVFLAVLCVWLLARRVLRPLSALAAALMTLTLQYFSSWALEFNNDVIAISVWAAAMLFCYRAIVGQKTADWCLTAFFCFVAVMTKYYAFLLVGLLGLAVLGHQTGRKSFRRPGLYCASLLFLVLILPNFIWLVRNDFLPFTYAAHSASTSGELQNVTGLMRHYCATASFFRHVLERIACFLPVFLVLFSKRERPENRIEKNGFDLFYITLIALGPPAVTLLLPLLGGLQIKITWLASCFSFLGVWLFLVLDPVVTRRRIMLLVAILGVYAVVLGIDKARSLLWRLPYRDRKCSYEVYPGEAIAKKAEELWAKHVPDRNRPLEYVIAPRKEGCSLSYYASSHPHSCYFYDFRISPWCDPEDLKRSGALVLWEVHPQRDGGFPDWTPDWLRRLPEKELIMAGKFDFDRLTRPWFRSRFGKPVRQTRIVFAILPPAPRPGESTP